MHIVITFNNFDLFSCENYLDRIIFYRKKAWKEEKLETFHLINAISFFSPKILIMLIYLNNELGWVGIFYCRVLANFRCAERDGSTLL